MQSDRILQQLLECCAMVQYCRAAREETHRGYHPMDATVGEMDWIWELHILLERTGLKMHNEPNARQVGGEHYRKANPRYQHWDIVADFKMNYYTGCLTKYVARWRYKNGISDLEKALHYTDKLISLYSSDRMRWINHVPQRPDERLYRWCVDQNLTHHETTIIELAVVYNDADDLLRLRTYIAALHEAAVANAPATPAQPAARSTSSVPPVAGSGQP